MEEIPGQPRPGISFYPTGSTLLNFDYFFSEDNKLQTAI
jgi:hypothetical protein